MQIVQADGRGYQPVTIRWWIFNTMATRDQATTIAWLAKRNGYFTPPVMEGTSDVKWLKLADWVEDNMTVTEASTFITNINQDNIEEAFTLLP